jgi:hypothetical protein
MTYSEIDFGGAISPAEAAPYRSNRIRQAPFSELYDIDD